MNKKILKIIVLSIIFIFSSFIIPLSFSKFISSFHESINLTVSKIPEFTVEFYPRPDEKNLVTGSMTPQKFTYKKSQKLNANQFVKAGQYEFAYWSTQPDGEGTIYFDKFNICEATNVDGAVIKLYANFKSIISSKNLLSTVNNVSNVEKNSTNDQKELSIKIGEINLNGSLDEKSNKIEDDTIEQNVNKKDTNTTEDTTNNTEEYVTKIELDNEVEPKEDITIKALKDLENEEENTEKVDKEETNNSNQNTAIQENIIIDNTIIETKNL